MKALKKLGIVLITPFLLMYVLLSFPMAYAFIHIDGNCPVAITYGLIPGLLMWFWAFWVGLTE
jgi:hypothetical protein